MEDKIFVFDAYGTLFDVHSAVRAHASALGPEAERISRIWRYKQLEYSWINALNHQFIDFWELTMTSFDYAVESVLGKDGISQENRQSVLDAYLEIEPFPEVENTLSIMKDNGAKIAILSNGSKDMLYAAVTSANLTALIDFVFSADEVKTFKTNPAMYQMASDHYNVTPGQINFLSSNRWDIAGATKFGFKTIWINRTHLPDEYPSLPAGQIINNLSEIL